MSSKTYSARHPAQRNSLVRIFSGAGHLEIAVLIATLGLGLVTSLILGNFILGFGLIAAIAVILGVLLAVLGPHDPTGTTNEQPVSPESRTHEHARL